jgi:hypothetical protein
MVGPGPGGTLVQTGAGGVMGQRAAASLGAGAAVRDAEAEPDIPCGTVRGTEHVTGDRLPNERLLVWEPVRVGGEMYWQ